MAQANQADEPSMEEILASIRRIISDEDEQAGAGAGAEATENSENEAADDMGGGAEMSQDDLDKLFDLDEPDLAGAEEEEQAADDDMAAAMAAAAEDVDIDEAEDEDVLELTEDFALADDQVGDVELVGAEDVAFAEDAPADEDAFSNFDLEEEAVDTGPEPAPQPVRREPPQPAQSSYASKPIPDELPDVNADSPLASNETGDAVHAAFDNLANLFVGNQPQTVEELVREMLRPMLKAWLDQNLPGMVETLVKKEIERVTRRR